MSPRISPGPFPAVGRAMDSFEWNKILGAVLGTTLFIAGLNILVDEFMTRGCQAG